MENSIEFKQLIRLPDTKRIFGYRSDASVYQAIKDGLCTHGILISQRSRAWPDSEIKTIVAARIQGKTDDEIRALVEALHEKRKTALSDLGVEL
ncbi:MAG: transcriptional regulator [Betaproteobacteria bacterium]|nr:transcriptional regulator [Betaproteobacteria bacterium]